MKKHLVRLLAVAMMLALVTGCANKPAAGKDDPAPSSSNDKPAKVALLLTSPLGDGGNMDSMYAGLKKAEADFGIEIATYEALESGAFEDNIRSFCEEDFDLIMSMWGTMNDQFNTLAGTYPDTTFVMNYCCGYEATNDNYTGFDYATYQAYYVCGVAEALVSKTGKLGYVAGSEDSTIFSNYNSFVAGAKSINPDVEVTFINANSHQDAAKGKEIAISLFDGGVDVIMCDASTTTLGVIEAAEDYGVGYYCGGDALDHSSYGPGSVLIDTRCSWDDSIYTIVDMYLKGDLDGANRNFDYSNGVVGTFKNQSFAENCGDAELAARMPEIWEKVEAVENGIVDGSIVVEYDPSAPNK